MKRCLFILSIILFGCGSTENNSISVVINIPDLIGKNIDQIKTSLGKPVEDDEPTQKQVRLGMTEWNKEFKIKGYDLLVTYDTQTRTVKDFFIDATHHSCDSLEAIANLKADAANYTFTHQNANMDENNCLGVKITPK